MGDDSENDGNDGAVAPRALSVAQQERVDEAFFDLFGYHFGAPADDVDCELKDERKPRGKPPGKSPAKGRRTVCKQRSILSAIFGARTTMKLMSRATFAVAKAGPRPAGGGMLRLERRTISEVKRFAGQDIRVERVELVPVMAGDDEAEESAARRAAAQREATTSSSDNGKARGVDELLSELARPEKLSTMSKTSADWDLFKAKSADANLKEQLESQALGKEAYLVKKDFLNRVDSRRFELEKAKRERERARRGK